MFSYFHRTAQARLCGLIWQVKPQVSNELKHLLKSELALSHWALTMCLKLSPCLIALLNKTGITGMLSQHQWLGNLALLLSEQSKRLWRGNLSLKHWREFSSGYYSSCASSSAAVRITWQTQIISVLTEHRALLVACHFQREEQSLSLFTGGTQLLLQQFAEPPVSPCRARTMGETGKGTVEERCFEILGGDEAGFIELCLRGSGREAVVSESASV